MYRPRFLRLSVALALLAASVSISFAQTGNVGDNSDCNTTNQTTPNGGDNGNCRNNSSATSNSSANGGTGGAGGTAQGGTASGGTAGVNDYSSVTYRSHMIAPPVVSIPSNATNSGNLAQSSSACGQRVVINSEPVTGAFFPMFTSPDKVPLGNHEWTTPDSVNAFTEQVILLPNGQRTVMLLGHQVTTTCSRVATSAQRAIGIGGGGNGGSWGSASGASGGLTEQLVCRVSVSGCVYARIDTTPEPKAPPAPAAGPAPLKMDAAPPASPATQKSARKGRKLCVPCSKVS